MALNQGQLDAVNAKDKDLMISASAGAGKTYSLCMRILRELKSGEKSLDRMLIVTFTKAAAAELRSKLAKELKKAIDEEEDGEIRSRLREQKSILPGARISTIDSFCFDLVKEHFADLGISPRIRIADDSEMTVVKNDLMRRAVDNAYKRDKDTLAELFGNLSGSYNDPELYPKLVGLCTSTEALPEGIDCLKAVAEEMEKEADLPFSEGKHGSIVTEKAKNDLKSFIRLIDWFCELYENDPRITAKSRTGLSEQREYFEELLLLADKPEEFLDLLDRKPKMNSVSVKDVENEPEGAFFKYVRSNIVNKYANTYRPAYETAREYKAVYTRCAKLTRCLYELLADYRSQLEERKEKTGAYEFADIERMAWRLLVDGEGKTPLAARLSDDFDELYIDEYQDVNGIQDAIFRALSKNNRYVVGDVKQSIYGFRGACPAIFSGLRESYPDYSAESDAPNARIFFRENFRSTREILSFVNAAIGPLMRAGTDMEYRNEDDLCPNEEKSEHGPRPVLCKVRKNDPRWQSFDKPEIAYVAKSVAALMKNGVKGKDIAILTRSNTDIPKLRDALAKEGIESESNFRDGFFERPEILLLRSLVGLLDNPTHDVCLASAMRSPVFGFTLDDLARIRAHCRRGSFFAAVQTYAAGGEDEVLTARCARVLSFIAAYRRRARTTPADTLVFRMMDELMILPLLTADRTPWEAAQIKENVLGFYDIARGLCASGAADVGKLARGLEALADKGKIDMKTSPEVPEDHVRVMTVHASKGLEFEVCWLYGAGKSIFQRGGSRLNFSKDLGLAFSMLDEELPWIRGKTPVEAAYEILDKRETVNEEMRLLYVALTRAKKRLFVSAEIPDNDDAFRALENCPKEFLCKNTPLLVPSASYIRWMTMALAGRDDVYDVLEGDLPDCPEEEAQPGEAAEEKDETVPVNEELKELFARRLDFVYPWAPMVDLPVKKAVSKLSPSVLDEDGGEEEEEERRAPDRGAAVLPRFYAESKGILTENDAALSGTATHAFMQFCDFENLERNGFDREAERLLDKGFLTRPVLARVEKRAVERFLESFLFSRLKNANKVYRERRFMIALPAAEFTSDPARREALEGETLLVQGVIDCFFEDAQGDLVLFDYKTDHFTREELRDRDACAETLVKRHKTQLSYYREAIFRTVGREVDRTYIYSFALNREIEVEF